MNRFAHRLLEQPWVYRAWQSPFADQKFAPILAHNDLRRVRRVLDVGCGPGTNAKYFAQSDYLGVDINPEYIAHATRRHHREFVAADVRSYSPPADTRFDFVLVNSFLHHLDSADVESILSHVSLVLAEDGYVHILEPAMPPNRSVSQWMARLDRGQFTRSLAEWQTIFSSIFDPVLFGTYPIMGAGITLWKMIYFKGRPRK